MVFRQLIAQTLADRAPAAIGGIGTTHSAAVLQPFPTNEPNDFPTVLRDALPPLAGSLEYRLIGDDLVIRDDAFRLHAAADQHTAEEYDDRDDRRGHEQEDQLFPVQVDLAKSFIRHA